MDKGQGTYDYGECETCGCPLEERRINQDFWIRGELLVVEDVPTGVCPRCGEKVVRAEVGRHIGRLVQDVDRIDTARRISVPALKFDAEVPA